MLEMSTIRPRTLLDSQSPHLLAFEHLHSLQGYSTNNGIFTLSAHQFIDILILNLEYFQ